MPKRFTLSEAQRLIPQVEPLLRAATESKARYIAAEGDLNEIREHASMMGGVTMNRDRVTEAKDRREAAAVDLRSALEEITEIGCVVKDLDTGLIDFPTLLRGTEVYLCWRLGEASIEFWHGVDEGFRGRKAIDQDFIDNHQGDRSQ